MKVAAIVQIRPARHSDVPEMVNLIRELALYEKALHEVTVNEAHFTESGFGPYPVWWALVAVIPASEGAGERIVGFALYYIRYSTWKGQRMYLEDLIVKEAWRGKGIGSRLMDALIDIAKERQFSGMMWQVLGWNESAINFYRKYNARLDGAWINCSLEL